MHWFSSSAYTLYWDSGKNASVWMFRWDAEGDTSSLSYPLDTPVDFQKASRMAYKIDVIWRPVSGASGYDVYRSKSASGTYEYVGRMSTYYYEDFDVTPGSTFYYKVRAVRGYSISDFSDVFRCSAEHRANLWVGRSNGSDNTGGGTL